MTRSASNEVELPQRITVKLVGANGEVTSIGEIDTKTGDVTFDGWYTIDGVRLSGKPSKSYTDPEPTPPNEIPDYDDWLE